MLEYEGKGAIFEKKAKMHRNMQKKGIFVPDLKRTFS